MSAKQKDQIGKADAGCADLQLAFDVGHSSLGWAVLRNQSSGAAGVDLLGCGVVTFRADDCLASARRAYRRQRRHIRSTRQRIARMKILLAHLGVLKKEQLDLPGCAWPWLLAARVLRGGPRLTWPELWDVLRWYAHNRGYDGNRRWSATETEAQAEDTEKEENARSLMNKHRVETMAETFCAISGLDPLGKKKSCHLPGDKRPKGQNAAFPRATVEGEVRRILRAHFGKLLKVDEQLERVLLGCDHQDAASWKAIPCSALKMPKRYQGALLFGQLVPRFDNRIISICPISEQKVPSRNCPEFLNFRWAMQLANIRIACAGEKDLRPLTAAERGAIDQVVRERGGVTPFQLKLLVREKTKCVRDDLEQMLMLPDFEKALLLDPVQKLTQSDELLPFWNLLPERLQKRLRGQWRRGKVFTLAQIRAQLESLSDTSTFDLELQSQLDAHNTKAKRKDKQTTREELLQRHFPSKPLKVDGRAAFARHLLKQAYDEVLAGKHPKEEGGCLFISEEIRKKELNREIAEQTNNHLVRHRLLILERLLGDIIKEYASNDKARVGKIIIEVNRDLQAMSGKNSVEKTEELNKWLAPHKRAKEKLEKMLAGSRIKIGQGLIRKAMIADDVGWNGQHERWICPYTNQFFDAYDLASDKMQKDHIVPKTERASDALEALVMTFRQVNEFKKKRTAWAFVNEEQGKRVPGTNLDVRPLSDFEAFAKTIPVFQSKGRQFEYQRTKRLLPDEARRKKKRELLLLPTYEEKEFTPRDSTQTSQLVRLGAQVLLRALPHLQQKDVFSLPGSVTGTVRKSWDLNGCLELACPQVMEEATDEKGRKIKRAKIKSEIRGLTHLHHALDACVLGLASHFIPNTGQVWKLLTKRNLSESEKLQLTALRVFDFNAEKRFEMRDLDNRLKEQIRQRLAEKRVVQHVPARMDGLRVEQNTWRVVSIKDGEATIQQRIRQADGSRPLKRTEEKIGKLLGLEPGKLSVNKGVLVIPDNFGVALDPQPAIIPFQKVWPRLQEIKKANGGKMPRVLRNGQLIRVPRGSRTGIWRVMSTKSTEAYGLALDLALPDRVKLDRGNAPIETLIQDGLEILECSFVGIDSSGIVISESKKRPRKPKTSGTNDSCPNPSSA